jgi:hypothetical protein
MKVLHHGKKMSDWVFPFHEEKHCENEIKRLMFVA